MKKIYLSLLLLVLFAVSCDLQLQENPNALSPDQADPDFVLNSLEFGLNEFFAEVTDYGMEVTRLVAMQPRSSEYATAWSGVDFDDLWEIAYGGLIADSRNLVVLSEANNLTVHSGIAKVIEAYTIITLVDMFGDVPYSQALDATNFNPAPDSGAEIYSAAEMLLDESIAFFAMTPSRLPANDLFYGGDAGKWTKLANTLKLKMYTNMRLVDPSVKAKIDAIAGSVILDPADDWEFPFSTVTSTTPSSVHPYFQDNYGAAADYQSNYFMNELIQNNDPRLRYYFYRQVSENTTDVNEQSCVVESAPPHYVAVGAVYCNPGNGYWGRDHIDTDGIPPDNQLRTVFGVYPVGGLFDADQAASAVATDGLAGAGIHPLMQSSFVNYMLAECAATIGTAGDARAYLSNAVQQSMDKVLSMGASQAVDSLVSSPTVYLEGVLSDYDAAADKTDVINRQYYYSLFGNGLEAYNNYRRTGQPDNAQPALNPLAGPFIRSFALPSASVDRNANMNIKPVTVQVFWDNNPANFIN